jgi:hypothetical protein
VPIFLSYSHEDANFVDWLATKLIRAKHHIWIDRWELKVGDSLTARIQESLTESSAILVILSRHSVESEWCKRELTAGLVRELEEKNTLVLPCIVDDCKIPLFLRDKLYADFRKSPQDAFVLLDKSLVGISNATMSQRISPEFNTDFALEWKTPEIEYSEETWIVRWTFVDHGPKLPYVVISELRVFVISDYSVFEDALRSGGVLPFILSLARAIWKGEEIRSVPLSGILNDNKTKFVAWKLDITDEESYLCHYSYRRLGIDNGMDTYVYLDNNIKMALDHLESTVGT